MRRSSPLNRGADAEERVILVDRHDREVGDMEKLAAHHGEGALHRAFSVFIFDPGGRTLLQRRARVKYHFGGLWSNACCGHPRPGETVPAAARRRLGEEMGIVSALRVVGAFAYEARDPASGLIEREIDHVLVGAADRDPSPDPDEAEAWRWIHPADFDAELAANPDGFTPWLAHAWAEAAGAGPPSQP